MKMRWAARRGVALLNAMFFTAIVTILLLVSINYTHSAVVAGRTEKYHAQAYHVARAGLVDAIGWYKRQTSQPVTAFAPSPNPSNPPRGDTWDPYAINPGGTTAGTKDLGIVQEFELSPGLWARYEVGKLTSLDRDGQGKLRNFAVLEPDASGTFSPVPIPAATSTGYQGVQDVTREEGLNGSGGLAWRLRSHGYVYRRGIPSPVPTVLFYQQPNEVLDQVELETEIRRLALNYEPYNAAITGDVGGNLTFNNGTSVKVDGGSGNGYAVLYNTTPSPNPAAPPATFTGSPQVYKDKAGAPYTLDWDEVFDVSSGGIFASLADFVDTSPGNLPPKLSTMSVIYLKPSGTATFNSARPLNGGGILAVEGDMTIAAGSNSSWAGFIYVTGNLVLNSPCTIAGAIVCKGNVTLNSSSASNPTVVTYSPQILSEVRTQLGQYRESRAALKVIK